MISEPKSPGWGYLYVILAAIFWAVSGSASKYLFNSGITPFQVVQLRITIAVGVLFVFFYLKKPALLRIHRQDIFYFVMLGIFGMGAIQFTYLYAISKINVAAAILLQDMCPIFIALYSLIFLRELPSLTTGLAIVTATAGCYLVVGAYNLSLLNISMAGIISGICSALAFACYSMLGEYGMRRYGPWTVLFYAMLFGAVAWNLIQPPFEAFFQPYPPVAWAWILYIAILGTLLPFGLYLEGVNLIRATRASITAILEPITAGLLSYIFLNEVMEGLQMAGGLLVIGAIVILQLKQEYDDQSPAMIRAKSRNPVEPHAPGCG